MKCQSYFLEKNKQNISKCLLKFLPRVLSVIVYGMAIRNCVIGYKQTAKPSSTCTSLQSGTGSNQSAERRMNLNL